ncbi:PAS domain S-box protein [Prosthecobacter sp.]|uniref:PAS domain S-box protein n=1 Tax=Prosthecobacter sp. TaxID=1965333 RepID=UPI002AC8AF58|nr:PAS domain S-box protein [Prosthecobacter sp.]
MPQNELERLAAFQQAVLSSAGAGIISTTPEGVISLFNPEAGRMLGYTADELLGKLSPGIFHVEAEVVARAAEVSQELNQVVTPGFEVFVAKARLGQAETREWTYVRKDGSQFPVLLTITAMRDETGGITGFLGVVRDITERKRAAAERDRFFDLSLDLLCIAKTDGYFKRLNPAFTAALGWSAAELMARPFLDFVHPDDQAATLAEVGKLSTGQPTLHFENRYQCQDGSWRTLAWRTMPQQDGTLYATARDVTAERAAAAALRHSEESLAVLLHSIGDAVLATDPQRKVTRMNPVAETLTGWTQAEALGRPIEEVFRIINEATRQPAVIPVDDVLATGEIHGLANHTVIISRDGTERAIEDSAAPIRDLTGRIRGVVLVFRDVTDARQVERFEREQRERTARFQTALLAMRDHEGEDAQAFFRHATAQIAEALRVERVSLWLFDEAQAAIECRDLVHRSTGCHESGARLAAADYPDYFAALQRLDAIVASEARTHPATHEFTAGYLDPLGITSMLDVPVREGEVVGVLCCEHTGPARQWTGEECKFAVSAACFVMMEIEQERRRKAETALREMNLHLEQLVADRTASLAANERRFRATFESAAVGIAHVARDGTFLRFNSQFCKIVGHPHAELVRKTFQEITHPDDLARDLEQAGQLFSGVIDSYTLEKRYARKDGTIVWVHLRGSVVDEGAGGDTYGLAVITDITERKQTEAALRVLSSELSSLVGEEFFVQAALKLAAILEVESAFVCVPLDEERTRFRTLAFAVDGVPLPNVEYLAEGTPCAEVGDGKPHVVPSGAARRYPADRMLAEMGVEAYAALPVVDSKGGHKAHLGVMSRKPLPASPQLLSILQLFGVRLSAEMERQQSEQRFHDLFEFAPDAILMTNRDGIITLVNRQAEQLFGYTRAELVGQPAEILMPPVTGGSHVSLRQQYLETAMPRHMGGGRSNLQGLRKDGSVFPVDISLSPMQTDAGMMVAAAVRDISERVKAESAVQQSLQEKETLLKEIHHRVKNNLQVISSLLAMRTDTVADASARALLIESQHRVRAMSMIHERLYQSDSLARVDFSDYVSQLATFLHRNYATSGLVRLLVDADEEVMLNIDTAIPAGLILNELVSNAFKHAFNDGQPHELSVLLKQTDAGVSLTVADDGPGLPAGFETRKTESLGMELVETLTTQIKGRLTIASTAGASFRLDFTELLYVDRN